MGKLLRPIDKILIAFAICGDTILDLQASGYKAYRRGEIPFSELTPAEESKIEKSLNRLLLTKEITRIYKGGNPYLVLSGSKRNLFKRQFSLYKWRKEAWNGYWCVVSFDIPEKKRGLRDYLREKLKSLGFGCWQKSVLISPYSKLRADLLEWLANHKLAEFVSVTIVRDLTDGEDKALAFKVFNLEEVGSRYGRIIDDFGSGGVDKKNLHKRYFEVLEDDPLLPKGLLPKDWPGFKVEEMMR